MSDENETDPAPESGKKNKCATCSGEGKIVKDCAKCGTPDAITKTCPTCKGSGAKQKLGPPKGLDPTTTALLDGQVVWFDTTGDDRSSARDDDLGVTLLYSDSFAREIARRLDADPRQITEKWKPFADARLGEIPAICRVGHMQDLLCASPDPSLRALGEKLAAAVIDDIKAARASEADKAARRSAEWRARQRVMAPATAKRMAAIVKTAPKAKRIPPPPERRELTVDLDGVLVVNGERADGSGRGPMSPAEQEAYRAAAREGQRQGALQRGKGRDR